MIKKLSTLRKVGWIVLLFTVASLSTQSQSNAPSPIPADTSWIGNTFGRADNKWVQMDARGMYVASDGTVYTNTFWEEGAREAGIYKDGDVRDQLDDTHGWGRLGGSAVTANSEYVYMAMQQGDEVSPRTGYPPKGTTWYGVRRYKNDGTGSSAPFTGGNGYDGSMLLVQSLTDGTADVRGLAVDSADRLYVSDGYDNQIKVYDANTMDSITSWSVDSPRQLAVGDDDTLWVIQEDDGASKPKILHYSNDGTLLPQQIPDIAAPAALSVDKQGRLLVADNGPDQQIKIYADLKNKPTLAGTLGERGGIFSGTPGEVEPLKFNGLTGVGSDEAGNIYVSYNGMGPDPDSTKYGTGLVLQSYSPSQQLNWELLGLEFVDNADVDPTSDGQDVYTKNEHFRMDFSKPGGQQWNYTGYTLNPFKYPDDPRLHLSQSHTSAPFYRRIQGKPFLFVTDMYSGMLRIYRFDPATDGEVAIPSGLFAKDHLNDSSWPSHQPAAGEWIWRDGNGNGSFDSGEYDSRNPSDTPYLWGWWVDNEGDVWQANRDNKGIRHFPLQGLDEHGNPIYTYASMQTISSPKPFDEPGGDLQRIEYDSENDTMYLGGYTSANPNPGDDQGFWGLVGKVVVRYDDWSRGNRTPRWQVVLPYSKEQMPKAMSVAGGKLFVAYVYTAEVHVYDAETGAPQGVISPGPEVGSTSGWVDIPHGIRAYQRSGGEYLIFVEEDAYAKVIMHRWDGKISA